MQKSGNTPLHARETDSDKIDLGRRYWVSHSDIERREDDIFGVCAAGAAEKTHRLAHKGAVPSGEGLGAIR